MTESILPVELAFDEYGEADAELTIVIAHGLFGSSTNWRGIARKLSPSARVLCVDMRNHGSSPWDPRHDYPALASDLAGFISSKANGGRVILVGHSMGGKAAMHMTLDNASLIHGLVVVDIAPVTYSHTHDGFIEAMQAIDPGTLSSRSDADAALVEAVTETPVRQFLLQNLVVTDGSYRWRINLDVLDQAMDDLVSFRSPAKPSVCPALFIYGTASDYVGEARRAAILESFPSAQLLPVEGAGHWVHAQAPATVIDAIVAFARSAPLLAV